MGLWDWMWGLQKKIDNGRSFWIHSNRSLFKIKHNETKFVAVLTCTVSHDFAVALVLSTLVHSGVWVPPCCKPPMNTAPNTQPQIPDSCPWWIAVFLNYTKWLLFLQKYKVLVMESRGLLIFSTAHKFQISMSPDHIVLKCLTLKIVWTAEIEACEKLLSDFFSPWDQLRILFVF